jgi:hypothetical protein
MSTVMSAAGGDEARMRTGRPLSRAIHASTGIRGLRPPNTCSKRAFVSPPTCSATSSTSTVPR